MKKNILGCLCVYFTLVMSALSANLLQNPGFEEPGEKFPSWTVDNTKNNGSPYVYLLTKEGGGHGEEGPCSGERAIEIYTSDRVTRLSQTVPLTPGVYRFSGYARNQMSGDAQGNLVIRLANQEKVIPVISMNYRLGYCDFTIDQTGSFLLEMTSSSSGLALDDLSLVRLEEGSSDEPPYLFFDLVPTSLQRSRGIQPYLRGQQQWMNFTISCLDLKRVDHPSLHFYVPPGVKLSGINELLLNSYRAAKTTDCSVKVTTVVREGVTYEEISFAVPRFERSKQVLPFGGAWVEVLSGGVAKILIEFEDRGRTFHAHEITLVPVSLPARQATPKQILTVAYAVQNWTQSLPHRLDNLPRQFQLMGLNVWSDYGLQTMDASPGEPTAEEQVRIKAFEKYGVRRFWPNYASCLETQSGRAYVEPQDVARDHDRYVVKEDGTVDPAWYNLRYVAGNGKAWHDSVLAAYQRMLNRPRDQKLPHTYEGFINDGLEALVISYDRSTLQDFAAKHALDPNTVTVADLKEKFKVQWLAYNLDLYEQAMTHWVTALREINPQVKAVITAGSFGPIGASGPELPITVQTEWTKLVNFTMPQWYGTMRFYNSHWHDQLTKGLQEKVYGRENGRADVIPLLSISMGSGLEDPLNLRFKMFDFLSTSSVVKGIGYYIAANGFADGQFMVGLSEAHTLLADVEDFYASGIKRDQLARYEPENALKSAEIKTTVRVHTLAGPDRIALLTVISHSIAGRGEEGTVYLSNEFLAQKIGTRLDLVILDHLSKKTIPFAAQFKVDTRPTSNMALLEVVSKKYADEQGDRK
jgi:hypothetical protein